MKTHILCSANFFDNRAVYEIMWKNIEERGRTQTTLWSIRIACWIPKATNTQSEYVILIAFSVQEWLQERASVLRYMFIACIFYFHIGSNHIRNHSWTSIFEPHCGVSERMIWKILE